MSLREHHSPNYVTTFSPSKHCKEIFHFNRFPLGISVYLTTRLFDIQRLLVYSWWTFDFSIGKLFVSRLRSLDIRGRQFKKFCCWKRFLTDFGSKVPDQHSQSGAAQQQPQSWKSRLRDQLESLDCFASPWNSVKFYHLTLKMLF